MHETCLLNNGDVSRLKPCCCVACSHRRQAGSDNRSNLVGMYDTPQGGTRIISGWNEHGPYNHLRLAMFGSPAITTSKRIGFLPHTQLSEHHKGIVNVATGTVVKRGQSGDVSSGTTWNRPFGSNGHPVVQAVWKVLPFLESEDTNATPCDLLESLHHAVEPGFQTNSHSHAVLPVIASWLHSGGLIVISTQNDEGKIVKIAWLPGIVELWCGILQLHEMYRDYYKLFRGLTPLHKNTNGYTLWKGTMLTAPCVLKCIEKQKSDLAKGLVPKTYAFGTFKNAGNGRSVLWTNLCNLTFCQNC
jgi:hypothetical protein